MPSAGADFNSSLGVLSTVRTVRATRQDGSRRTTQYLSDGSTLVTEESSTIAAVPPPEGASASVPDQYQDEELPMEDEPAVHAQGSRIVDEENYGEVANEPNAERNLSSKVDALRCGKYSITKLFIRRLRLLGLLYDILSDTYILFFTGIPEEVANVIIGPFVCDIVILVISLWYWKSVVIKDEPGFTYNSMSFVGLIWGDVTEFTVSLRYMFSCGIQALLAVKAAKFIVIFPIEIKSFWTLFLKKIPEFIGVVAMPFSLVFGVYVPLLNMKKVEEESGRSQLCSLFG